MLLQHVIMLYQCVLVGVSFDDGLRANPFLFFPPTKLLKNDVAGFDCAFAEFVNER